MLPSLDTRILSALSRDDGDDEELEFDPRGHISLIKTLIAEDSNWSDGMIRLLGLWPKIDPRLYRKKPMSTCHALYHKGGPNNWWIDFHVNSLNYFAAKSDCSWSSPRTRLSAAFALDQVLAASSPSMPSENASSLSK